MSKIPFGCVEREPYGILSFLNSITESFDLRPWTYFIIWNPKLGGFHITKYGNNFLPRLHHQCEFMKAKVRLTISRWKDCYANLAPQYCTVDILKELISRLHVLVVKKRWNSRQQELMIQQRCNWSLCVYATVVYENIASGMICGSSFLVCHLALDYVQHGWALHGFNLCLDLNACVSRLVWFLNGGAKGFYLYRYV